MPLCDGNPSGTVGGAPQVANMITFSSSSGSADILFWDQSPYSLSRVFQQNAKISEYSF